MNTTRKSSRKAAIVVAILLAVVIAASATWAWVTSSQSLINPVENQGYDRSQGVSVVEEFDPPEKFDPDTTVNKKVTVSNSSDGPVLVRVSFEEYLNLALLGQTGSAANEAVAWINANVAAPTGTVPAMVDIAAFSSWDVVDKTTIELGFTPPAGYNFASSNLVLVRNGDVFRAYVPIGTTGTYQAVKLAPIVENKTTDKITMTDMPQLGYFYWTARDTEITPKNNALFNSWSQKNLVKSGVNMVTGAVEDWSALYNASTSKAIPAFANIGVSTLSNDILLNYTPGNVVDTLTDGKWFYNAADGYFYFLGALESGQFTAQLLENYHLVGGANKGFDKNEYALGVTAEAIQATADAITASTGWNLSGDLAEKLQSFC